jgi:signal transduction histidine kinase
MQERVEEVGGSLKIRSRRGGGTMVECRVPLVAAV